jgi:catechol 2,3-dioxygenase-like lactoylglutathione lyase family enzyme
MSIVKFPAKNSQSKLASMTGNHVALRVPDFEQAVKWYTEKLDFRIIHQWPYADQQLAYIAPPTDDNFTVELLAGGNPPPIPRQVYSDLGDSLHLAGYHHFCLTVDKMEEMIVELRKRGVTVVTEPFYLEAINRRLAFIADPFGNLIELAESVV